MAGKSKSSAPLSPKVRAARQRAFLDAFRRLGVISYAADAAGISTVSVRKWRKDRKFEARFRRAEEAAVDALELEARRRAIRGVKEPVFYKGKICGYITRKSDTLLKFLLMGRRPTVFRDALQRDGLGGAKLVVLEQRQPPPEEQPEGTEAEEPAEEAAETDPPAEE